PPRSPDPPLPPRDVLARVRVTPPAPSRLCPGEPRADPLDRLVHLRARTRIAQAQEAVAAPRVEIDARGRRDMRLIEHAAREIEAVVREARYFGVKIEGPVHRQEAVEARFWQALHEDAP